MELNTKEKEFKDRLNTIKSKLRRGDLMEIERKSGYTRNAFYSARSRRKSWEDLTPMEVNFIDHMIRFLEERDKRLNETRVLAEKI